MEKLKMHSPNFVDQNIAKIAELFPNCVTESRNEKGELQKSIDFDLLKQELSAQIVEGPQERYQLNWPGKSEALLNANSKIYKTLRPAFEESVQFDSTQNLFIEGDNLEALKLLQETYLGQVKLIYIDPPYNTGKDFIYRDNFSISKEEHEILLNERDEEGGRLVSNPDSSGRFHSNWLTMIYSRLKIAHRLLSQDGLIFISIDDAEQANLKRVCDEIFGESNFIAQIIWEKGRKNDAKFFSVGHEYMLVYARDINLLRESGEIWREEKPGAKEIWQEFIRLKSIHGEDYLAIEGDLSNWYSNLPKSHPSKKWARYKRVDKFGPWRDRDISWPGGDGPKYDVIHPVTKQPCAVPERGWIYSSPDEMKRQIKLGLVEFRDDHTQPPFRKAHIRPVSEEVQDPDLLGEEDDGEDSIELATQVRSSYFYKQSQVAVKYLRGLMGAKVFNNPKDHEELAKIIEYVTPRNNSALIMDFFAGSASTAEAVFSVNASTGSKHKFITVQLPESLDLALSSATGAAKKTVQSAIKLTEEIGKKSVLSEISKERIRRAGKKIKEENAGKEGIENLDIGFRVLKIDTSNMADVYYNPAAIKQEDLFTQVDNVKPDRTEEDLLFQVMLDWGVDLTLPIERKTIQDKTVFFVDKNTLVACFDKQGGIDDEFVKELAKCQPVRAVFRDAGFKDDATKINVEQVFKLLSPITQVKSL